MALATRIFPGSENRRIPASSRRAQQYRAFPKAALPQRPGYRHRRSQLKSLRRRDSRISSPTKFLIVINQQNIHRIRKGIVDIHGKTILAKKPAYPSRFYRDLHQCPANLACRIASEQESRSASDCLNIALTPINTRAFTAILAAFIIEQAY